MQGLLLDNWGICKIITRTSGFDNEKYWNKEYIDLLEAIVLWDDLYYPENEYSYWWKRLGVTHSINNIVKPIKNERNKFDKEIDIMIKNIPKIDDFPELVSVGALRYMLFSNKLGINYLPCKERSLFLEQSNFCYSWENIDRLGIIDVFDKEVIKYYKELNDFFGKNIFTFEFPLLIDYIIQNTPDNMSYIEYAIKLREDKCVVAFRRYLNEVEIAINNAEWNKLFKFEKETKGLVNDIFQHKKFVESISINLLALPSFNIAVSNLPFKKNIHLSFLRNLGNFAYKNRKLKKQDSYVVLK